MRPFARSRPCDSETIPRIDHVVSGLFPRAVRATLRSREPLAVRKARLERILARAGHGIRFNEQLDEEDGPLVFEHACKLGLEGIVSKRRVSPYSSGRTPHWIKSKNPNAPAVKREAEEDWSGRR